MLNEEIEEINLFNQELRNLLKSNQKDFLPLYGKCFKICNKENEEHIYYPSLDLVKEICIENYLVLKFIK